MAKTEELAYMTEAEKLEANTQAAPQRYTTHPKALAAQRLLSDEIVQELLRDLLDTFATNALYNANPVDRESARQQHLCVAGFKTTLEALARGEIPQHLL